MLTFCVALCCSVLCTHRETKMNHENANTKTGRRQSENERTQSWHATVATPETCALLLTIPASHCSGTAAPVIRLRCSGPAKQKWHTKPKAVSKINNTMTTVAQANEANEKKCNRTQIKSRESSQHQHLPTVTLRRPSSKSTGAFSEGATSATAVQGTVGAPLLTKAL